MLGPSPQFARSLFAWACVSVVGCGDSGNPVALDAGSLGTPDATPGDAVDAAADATPDAIGLDPTPWKSGARLRAKVKDGGDGAKLLDHWYDSVNRFGCSFARAPDARIRCLPVDEDTPVITTIFADSDCTKPIAIGPPPENPYVRIVDKRCGRSDDDEKPLRVIHWGKVIRVDTPYIVRAGVCSPITNGPDLAWNSIDDAAPEQFVAADEEIHSAPGGGAVRILHGEDGSRENHRLIDPRTRRSCEVVSDHVLGGPDLCVPTPFAAAPALPFYDSDTCERTIAFAEDGCQGALAGLMLQKVGCTLSVELVELGPPFPTKTTGIFRRGYDGVCRSDMLFSPMNGYATGQPFSRTAFASVASRSLGRGRLEARLHATSDGVPVRNARLMPLRYQLDPDTTTNVVQPAQFEFYDKVLQTKCRVEKVADETMRCIPTSTVPKLGQYFEDAACTQPVHHGVDPACVATGFVSIPGWLELGLPLRPTAEIRPIGAILQTQVYMYARDPGWDPTLPPRDTCVPVMPPSGRIFYALGAALPASQLAVVTETTE